MATETVTLTTEQLMSQIAAAGASGDITEVIRLGNILRKQKADIEKAEADKLVKEAEALAGVREKLAGRILKAVKPVVSKEDLDAVKATGFTFKAVHLDQNGVETSASVALTVPQVKTKKVGGNGGPRVSTKDETGMNLAELITAYATEEQKVAIQKAYDDATANKGSAKWQEQKRVKKVILKEHPELIQK